MSVEIQQIAHDLEAAGRIEINPLETEKSNIHIKSMKYIPKDINLEISSEAGKILDTMMKFVAGKTSRELEFLASVHFWAIRDDKKNDVVEYVHQRLHELNPETKFTKTDVEDATKELRKNKIL